MRLVVDARRAKGAEGMLGEGSAALLRVEQTDLINYGLIPEFVGRFPVISTLQARLPLRCCLTIAA